MFRYISLGKLASGSLMLPVEVTSGPALSRGERKKKNPASVSTDKEFDQVVGKFSLLKVLPTRAWIQIILRS